MHVKPTVATALRSRRAASRWVALVVFGPRWTGWAAQRSSHLLLVLPARLFSLIFDSSAVMCMQAGRKAGGFEPAPRLATCRRRSMCRWLAGDRHCEAIRTMRGVCVVFFGLPPEGERERKERARTDKRQIGAIPVLDVRRSVRASVGRPAMMEGSRPVNVGGRSDLLRCLFVPFVACPSKTRKGRCTMDGRRVSRPSV